MVRIQLETGYLEVAEGTEFPLNFGVAEVRDLSARSGTFSKSIKLVGTDNNNQLLNHYYDVNIEAGTFDINALTRCSVIQNGLPILEDCYLQLVSVDKVQKDNGHEEGVEYTVLVKDAQSDFFTKMDNQELTDLDLTDLNHTYNSTNVTGTFSNTSTDGYMYPLMFTPDDEPLLTDFKPAVYAKTYWDRIHATNGFSYTWSSLSDDNFDKLVIPYNGDTPEQDYEDYKVIATKLAFTPTLGSAITSWTEALDDEALFNPTTGVYNSPFYIGAGQSINYQFEFDIDIDLVNGTGANAYLVDTLSSGSTQGIKYEAKVFIYNGSTILAGGTIGSDEWLTTDNPLPNGTNTLANISSTLDVQVNNLLPTDNLTVVLQLNEIATGSTPVALLDWQDAASGGSSVSITKQIVVNRVDMRVDVSVDQLGFGQTIQMNQFIPRKVKQKDFVKSICMMYNLIVDRDADNPNKLIYKTRDSYYDDGATKDWTAKLAKDRPQNLEFLPDLSAKKLLMTYKEGKDAHNTVYQDATNEIYGQVEYTYTNEYVKGVDKKELIFSPTPMVWNGFGAVVPAINANSPKTNIRILQHNSTKTCNGFTIIDYGTTGTASTTYPHVSHFDDHFNPTFDINFAPCDYYFYSPIFTLTNNNLFNKYWRRTIGQINEGKMLTAYFDLNEADIQTLDLSDKIRIDNSWWNINRVIDYNANKDQLTKVELISVDDSIDLPNFGTKPVIPSAPNVPNIPNGVLVDDYYSHANLGNGQSIVKGKGNVIESGVKAIVIGDNTYADRSGIWINGDNVVDASQPNQIKEGYVEIGSWDMDTDALKSVTLPVSTTQIIELNVVIFWDNGVGLDPIYRNSSGVWSAGGTNIQLFRSPGGYFDNTNFDDSTINRGYITFKYI